MPAVAPLPPLAALVANDTDEKITLPALTKTAPPNPAPPPPPPPPVAPLPPCANHIGQRQIINLYGLAGRIDKEDAAGALSTQCVPTPSINRKTPGQVR